MDFSLIDETDCIFADLIKVLDELMYLLKEEHDAIIDYDLLRINQACSKKNNILLKLKALESAKNILVQKLAAQFGLKGNPSTQLVLKHIPDKKRAAALKQKVSCLLSLAQAVEEYNSIQREHIQLSLNTVQAELMILDPLQSSGSCYNKKAEIAVKNPKSMGGMMDQSF